ncbi:MAG: N-acetylmuramic acid 6-phosphate etherase [Lacrimispora sp.]|uniref:N-acetylmuramic acid 6-phosphate etherase n=1 Tax=Lacrimispora sp. TaxID=2719234 RepID=UPI0039E61E2D
MLEHLKTELRNSRTTNIDVMSAYEICRLMNEEDRNVPLALAEALGEISKAVDCITAQYKKGGRIIYIGAGTSGRLGVLDAVECVPTFGVFHDSVIGIIAGGDAAFFKAVEGAEDSKELAEEDLKNISLNKNDVVIGIAASGRTPYVIGALEYANSVECNTVSIACNKDSEIGKLAGIAIEVDAGSEVLTGSTRLKAGTAQKLILNMISTATMILNGKAYKNLMVDVLMTNEKLRERGRTIVMEATGVDYDTADEAIKQADNQVKVAIVSILKGCPPDEARQALEQSDGFVRKAIELN